MFNQETFFCSRHLLFLPIDGGNNAPTKIDSRYCYLLQTLPCTVRGTVLLLLDVLLILHVSRTTKIAVMLLTISSTYIPQEAKKWETSITIHIAS